MAGAGTVAHIQPQVLRWARESAGYSLRQAADKIGIDKWYLEMVEGGSDLLTLREAERAADAYDRPLAALFAPVSVNVLQRFRDGFMQQPPSAASMSSEFARGARFLPRAAL